MTRIMTKLSGEWFYLPLGVVGVAGNEFSRIYHGVVSEVIMLCSLVAGVCAAVGGVIGLVHRIKKWRSGKKPETSKVPTLFLLALLIAVSGCANSDSSAPARVAGSYAGAADGVARIELVATGIAATAGGLPAGPSKDSIVVGAQEIVNRCPDVSGHLESLKKSAEAALARAQKAEKALTDYSEGVTSKLVWGLRIGALVLLCLFGWRVYAVVSTGGAVALVSGIKGALVLLVLALGSFGLSLLIAQSWFATLCYWSLGLGVLSIVALVGYDAWQAKARAAGEAESDTLLSKITSAVDSVGDMASVSALKDLLSKKLTAVEKAGVTALKNGIKWE